MAASVATSGFGAVFAYLSTDPTTYTSLSEVVSITVPEITVETIDVTHHASDDGFREIIAGLKDGGEATVTMNYIEASATLLQTLVLAGRETFRITFNGASTYTFTGVPTAFSFGDLVIDDKMTMSLTIKVSGKPTFAAV